MKIKVSDFIVKRLVKKYGVKCVFMVTGGGAMHLNISFGRTKKIKCIFCHHEQACAIAAEGYSRVSGKLGVVNVTSGPGGLNTLTGVMGQWTDSVPVLYISGQVKSETTITSCSHLKLRQLGDQEVDIISIVRPITKFAISVRNPYDIKRLLDKAIYIARTGRPGPVWLDIPLDIQGAMVEEEDLLSYDSNEDENIIEEKEIASKISLAFSSFIKSQRPILIAGNGIRIADAQKLLLKLIEKLKIPVVTTFNGFDLVPSNNPYFIGRIGTHGTRGGNFALQNADFALFIGTRNNIRQITYNWKEFARNAKKIVVDIDSSELKKPTLVPDVPINCDAKYFLENFFLLASREKIPDFQWWLDWCKLRKKKYPVVLANYLKTKKVQPYYFVEVLTNYLQPGSCIISGNATASITLFQAGIVKRNSRVCWNSGCASMGYDLPAAVGACFGRNGKKTICITGDGSIQMNIQELQTVAHYKLPIKIFVLKNNCYISIKQTQKNFFGLPLVGCDKKSGVSFPSFVKVAKAYGIKTITIRKHREIRKKLKIILETNEPYLCEVLVEEDYKFIPRVSSKRNADGKIVSSSLEDMYPFLKREEFRENIIN